VAFHTSEVGWYVTYVRREHAVCAKYAYPNTGVTPHPNGDRVSIIVYRLLSTFGWFESFYACHTALLILIIVGLDSG